MWKLASLRYFFFVFVICITINIKNLYPYDYLPDNISVSDILLVIAHNSPQAKAYGWRYYQQLGNLTSQWKAGARGVKVNLHWRLDVSKTEQLKQKVQQKFRRKEKSRKKRKVKNKIPYISLAHESSGKSNCFLSAIFQKKGKIVNAVDYFKEFTKLIKDNSQDIAVIFLEDYLSQTSQENGAAEYTPKEIKEKLHEMLEESGITKYAYKLTTPCSEKWPTVGEMRKNDKRVIIFTDDKNHAQDSSFLNNAASYVRSTAWEYDWKEDLKSKTCKMHPIYNNPSTQAFTVVHGPINSINKGSKKGIVLTIVNKIKKMIIQGTPVETTDYRILYSEGNIRKRLQHCRQASPGSLPSLLKMDFVEIGDVYETVRKINMERIKEFNGKETEEEKPSITIGEHRKKTNSGWIRGEIPVRD